MKKIFDSLCQRMSVKPILRSLSPLFPHPTSHLSSPIPHPSHLPPHPSSSPAFTLIELLVVVAMIAVLIGAMTTSVSAARERAQIQRATSEVKIISQAILAYENYNKKGDQYGLEEIPETDADSSSLGFLLGAAAVSTGGKMPVLLMAQLKSGGKMLDPWGMPYRVKVHRGSVSSVSAVKFWTDFFLPNYWRVER